MSPFLLNFYEFCDRIKSFLHRIFVGGLCAGLMDSLIGDDTRSR